MPLITAADLVSLAKPGRPSRPPSEPISIFSYPLKKILSPEAFEKANELDQWAPGFLQTLSKTEIKDAAVLNDGVAHLHAAFRASAAERSRGGYLDGLTREGTEILARKKLSRTMDQWLRYHRSGATIAELERFFTQQIDNPTLPTLPWFLATSAYAYLQSGSTHNLMNLPLGQESKRVLARYFERGRLFAKAQPGSVPFRDLLRAFESAALDPELRPLIEKALSEAGTSPLGALRIQRLYRILSQNDFLIVSKIREMGDPDLMLRPPRTEGFNAVVGEGQLGAYLNDPEVVALMRLMDAELPRLHRSPERELRQEHFHNTIFDRWRHFGFDKDWNADLFASILENLDDPLSQRVAAELVTRKLQIAFVGSGYFEQIAYESLFRPGPREAKFANSAYFKDTVVFRSRHEETDDFSRKAKILGEMLGDIVYEYQNHRKETSGKRPPWPDVFKNELMSYAHYILFRARNGDFSWAEEIPWNAPGGFALQFRNYWESRLGRMP